MKNLEKVLISKTRNLAGLKYDTSVIPKGIYCYEYDKKTTEMLIDEWDNGFYVRVCPYHTSLNKKTACCLYTGKITKDEEFINKNKNCNINKHA